MKVNCYKDPRGTVKLYSFHRGVVGSVAGINFQLLGVFPASETYWATVITMLCFVWDWWLDRCWAMLLDVYSWRHRTVFTGHRIQLINWPCSSLERALLWSKMFRPISHNCVPCQTTHSPESTDCHRLSLSVPVPDYHITLRKGYVKLDITDMGIELVCPLGIWISSTEIPYVAQISERLEYIIFIDISPALGPGPLVTSGDVAHTSGSLSPPFAMYSKQPPNHLPSGSVLEPPGTGTLGFLL